MMHVPPASFRPDPVQPGAAALVVPPLTPAGYFRLRRLHAGLTVAQLADRLLREAARRDETLQRDETIAFIHQLETDGISAKLPKTIRRIAEVMPIDAAVYGQLKLDPANHPQVCRGCGYNVWDAYSVEDMLLGWATATSCTRCTPSADADL
jgi:hypothetical protein